MITAYRIAIKVRLTNQLTSSYLCCLYKICQGLTSNILLCVPDTSDNLQCVLNPSIIVCCIP